MVERKRNVYKQALVTQTMPTSDYTGNTESVSYKKWLWFLRYIISEVHEQSFVSV